METINEESGEVDAEYRGVASMNGDSLSWRHCKSVVEPIGFLSVLTDLKSTLMKGSAPSWS